MEKVNEISYKISTITMTMQLPNCILNLNNIGRYLEIDDMILGIKYHYGNSSIIKGKYLTSIYKKSKSKNQNKINKKLFYNQVSLIIKHNCFENENVVNVKIFGNGSLHMTGVKNPLEGKEILLILFEKFKNLKNKYSIILLTKDSNDIYLDSNNNVYTSNETKNIIGFKLNSFIYVINKKEYYVSKLDIENDFDYNNLSVFISNKIEAKRTRSILDMNGILIGLSKINLIRNKSKLYKNNSNIHFDKNFIFYDSNSISTIIGNITYEFNENLKSLKCKENLKCECKEYIEYNYKCDPYVIEPNECELKNINNLNMNINTINIYFQLSFQLNRQRLFDKLLDNKYITEYTPEKYSGVKLIYKNNQNYKNNGICLCNNKCTCNNITFLIFQSGNIIVTGFKSINVISDILHDFKNLINNVLQFVIKKKFLL